MIQFPNTSRSYDGDRHRIRFSGQDNAIEVPFFLDENVIFKIAPKTRNGEPAILGAFDAARDRIMEVAARVHARAVGRPFYVLATADF